MAYAKSGSDWTPNDLIAYNITVTTQSPQEFFRQNHEPSLAGIDPTLIDSAIDADDVPDQTHRYLTHLILQTTNPSEESTIDDLARYTLCLLGFEERGLVLTGYIIPSKICGDNRQTTPRDVCLRLLDRRSRISLLLQNDNTIFNPTQPEPQVIAEAIAAYQYNKKRQARGLPGLDAMTIPCITMVGTQPTFYLVPVTQALSTAVVTGQYPEAPTEVFKCVTFLGHDRRSSEGMETPEYRRVAFQRYLAFKDLAKEHWRTFLV